MEQYKFNNGFVAGCDEAGRGCLAGPVVAAAVILPKNYTHSLLRDSKKLSENNRLKIRKDILNDALTYGIGFVPPTRIDEVNILNASFEAMHIAIAQLNRVPNLLLIDGNRFVDHPNIPHECVIKGDDKFFSIAAASILAKTERDAYMKAMAIQHPAYGWERNKGYPTKEHKLAISNVGATSIHRKSFNWKI